MPQSWWRQRPSAGCKRCCGLSATGLAGACPCRARSLSWLLSCSVPVPVSQRCAVDGATGSHIIASCRFAGHGHVLWPHILGSKRRHSATAAAGRISQHTWKRAINSMTNCLVRRLCGLNGSSRTSGGDSAHVQQQRAERPSESHTSGEAMSALILACKQGPVTSVRVQSDRLRSLQWHQKAHLEAVKLSTALRQG